MPSEPSLKETSRSLPGGVGEQKGGESTGCGGGILGGRGDPGVGPCGEWPERLCGHTRRVLEPLKEFSHRSQEWLQEEEGYEVATWPLEGRDGGEHLL